MRLLAGLLLAVALHVGAAAAAFADHQIQHLEPQRPAPRHFGDGFPELIDDEWEIPIGGFGGVAPGAPRSHLPVVFVHGNVVDHADWYPVRDDFLAAGWNEQELWALSYNGMGNGSGSSPNRSNPQRDEEHAGADNLPRGTNNDLNVPDLAAFIRAVQDYTGSQRYHLVGHSLGVTLARRTMQLHPDLADDVVSFVGIAGANHGTSLCAPGSEGLHMSCDEIALGTPWLEELNGPDGELETYGETAWLTIYDGTGGGDVAFVGPAYAQSPTLKGATNLEFPGMDHNGLRMAEEIVVVYREFIEQAEAALPAAGPGPAPAPAPPAGAPLPVTGAGAAWAALAALAAGVSRPGGRGTGRTRRCAARRRPARRSPAPRRRTPTR